MPARQNKERQRSNNDRHVSEKEIRRHDITKAQPGLTHQHRRALRRGQHLCNCQSQRGPPREPLPSRTRRRLCTARHGNQQQKKDATNSERFKRKRERPQQNGQQVEVLEEPDHVGRLLNFERYFAAGDVPIGGNRLPAQRVSARLKIGMRGKLFRSRLLQQWQEARAAVGEHQHQA